MRLIGIWGRLAIGLAVASGCAHTPGPVTIQPACTVLTMQAVIPQPRLPDGATVPMPTTEADADGLRLFLEHSATLAAWGREGWARLAAQQRACEPS